MYAALHFPDLRLSCLLAHLNHQWDQPAALLSQDEREKSHLLALNGAARTAGLTPKMPTILALARCHDLLLLDRKKDIEEATRQEVLTFAESLTPDFEATSGETFLLDLATLVYSSENDWMARTLSAAEYLALPLNLALGTSPDLAHLCALSHHTSASLDFAPRAKIHLPEKPLSPLALTLSELAMSDTFPLPHEGLLQLWGLETLEDLSKLPRQGLAERLGKELTRLHDILWEKERRLLQLQRPSEHYQAAHIFEPSIDQFEPILFVARRLLQVLCNRLRHHQRAAAELHVTLAFENGAAHFRAFVMPEPTLDPDILLQALHTHLDGLPAPAPVQEFHLKITDTLPAHKQHEIFSKGLKDPNQFADTLRRLSGIVGSNRLGIPQLLDTHRPDSFVLHPFTTNFSGSPSSEIEPTSKLPITRLRPPLSINVMSEPRGRFQYPLAILTGPYQGEILNTSGPFPISGSWWDSPWQEMQWDVELAKNQLFHLTHNSSKEWQLTGIYG